MRGRIGLVCAALCVLAACGAEQSPPAAEPAEPRPSVSDPMTGTIDRAREVQGIVDDQAAQQRRRLEEAER